MNHSKWNVILVGAMKTVANLAYVQELLVIPKFIIAFKQFNKK